jgi:glycosyltransferase involved in cell wall biosynthesis
MRILILSNSTHSGGAEKSAYILFQGLLSQNCDAHLVVVNSLAATWESPDGGSKVISLGRGKNQGYTNILSVFLKYQLILFKLRPHVVILNCEVPELLHAFAVYRSRLIAVEHTTNPWSFSPLIGKTVRKILLVKKTHWVGVATENVIWPSRRIPTNVIFNPVLSGGSDEKNFTYSEIKRLVFVGRLSPEKNPWAVMRIAKQVKKPALFIGEGIEGTGLKADCINEGVEANFLGFQKSPWDFTEMGDLLVIPSLWEGDGMVVREAISLGIPILLSRNKDLKRFALPERNYCESEDDFVERILQYGDNAEELIIGGSLKMKIVDQRDTASVLANWMDLISCEVETDIPGKGLVK